MDDEINSSNSFSFVFSDNESISRLDQYLQSKLNIINEGEYSRSQIANLIRNSNCKVNNKVITKPAYKLSAEDLVLINVSPIKSIIIPDPTVKFEIIYEDESILVISKPAGLVVHPAPGVSSSTLVHGLHSYLANSLSTEMLEEPERIGIVHRLDKDTSGIMVIAKTMKAKRNLQKQLLPPRSMKRIYHALIFGEFKNKRGVTQIFNNSSKLIELKLSAPISRHPVNRTKYKVEYRKTNFKTRDANTIFRILNSKDEFHLLECELMTGRTHQIRVHLEYLDIILLGDLVYGKTLKNQVLLNYPFLKNLKGQMLHSRVLELIHPITKEKISFIAEYPENFKSTMKNLEL